MDEPSTAHSDGPSDDVVEAVRNHSRPFPVPETGTFSEGESNCLFADVFDEMFDGRAIVGLGEATHGTHEFFRFKARLIRYLVEQRGYRLLCMEAQFTPTLALNDYVTSSNSADDRAATTVLDGADILGNWQCEAVADLIEWVRMFNDGRDPADQVAIHGIDAQRQHLPAAALSTYLCRAEVSVPSAILDALDTLDSQPYVQLDDEHESYHQACQTVADVLGAHFDAHESAYIESTSSRAFRRAAHQRRTIAQARQLAVAEDDPSGTAYNDIREAVMAENVSRLLDYAATDRAVVWAHNTHIGRGSLYFDDGEVPSLGERLDSEFGDYYALGLTTGSGRVRCYSISDAAFATPTIPEPPANSVPSVFAKLSNAPFVLDFDDIGAGRELDAWFATGPRRHYVGGAYRESPAEYIASDPRGTFDALAFFGSTTPARPLSKD